MDGDQPAPGRLNEKISNDADFEHSYPVDEYRPRRRSRNSVIYEASGADQLLELNGRLQSQAEEDEIDTTGEEFSDAFEAAPSAEADLDHIASVQDAKGHAYQEKGKDRGLLVTTVGNANGLGLPASPRSPLHSGHSSPQNLRIPNSHLPPSPRHAQRV